MHRPCSHKCHQVHRPLNHSVQHGGQSRKQHLTLFIINYAVLQDILTEINREGKDEYAAKASGYLNRMDMFYVYFGLKLSPATNWGVQNEPLATEAYITYQHEQGKAGLTVGLCGIIVSESYPFLGATPDRTVYDPTCTDQPFDFIEAKCPFSHRHHTPLEAGKLPSFFCNVQLSKNA